MKFQLNFVKFKEIRGFLPTKTRILTCKTLKKDQILSNAQLQQINKKILKEKELINVKITK